jgi:hypothetical protein
MTIEFKEVEAGQSKEMPAKIIIYGIPKVGKTRFAAQAEDVFFINLEGGLEYLPNKVRATPKLNTYDEVMAWFKHIYENENFKAGIIALDSLDWLETFAREKLIKQYGAANITDDSVVECQFYKAVNEASVMASKALKWLDAIYNKKGIKAIVIAHSEIKRVDIPNTPPFERHQMKLYKELMAKANEWADLILFADRPVMVAGGGKNGDKTSKGKVLSEPKPVLLAGGSASFLGGGRMLLSKELPLDYNAVKQHIEKGNLQ